MILKTRLDQALVDRKLVETRSKAKVVIEKNIVKVNQKIQNKPSYLVSTEDLIEIIEETYVGRGAYKLIHAIEQFQITFKDKVVADVGASTGGFTQIALKYGATKVYAIDVGHDQLAMDFRNDQRVINLEGTNIKGLKLPELADIVVVDLSFISIKQIFNDLLNLLKGNGKLIILIKPQFEAGKERLGKKGIIRDDQTRQIILDEVIMTNNMKNYHMLGPIESPIKGKDGNSEYLVCLTK